MYAKRKPRYCHQPHNYTCGPTAILNSLKWVGYPCTIKDDYNRLIEDANCTTEYGTTIPDFDRTLRQELEGLVEVKRKYRPTFKEIENWVKKDNQIAVLLYWHKVRKSWIPSSIFSEFKRLFVDLNIGGHYMLITDVSKTGKSFTCVNDFGTVWQRKREKIKEYVSHRRMAKKMSL